jgi:hypothetical protein
LSVYSGGSGSNKKQSAGTGCEQQDRVDPGLASVIGAFSGVQGNRATTRRCQGPPDISPSIVGGPATDNHGISVVRLSVSAHRIDVAEYSV